MSETDQVDERGGVAGDRPEIGQRGFDRRAFLRRTALTGVAAGSVSSMLAACGKAVARAPVRSGSGSAAVFGSHPSYKFVIVNHVTTNPFFVPTQYGAADACKLLGCSYEWTGSESSNVNQMVNAVNTAVTSGADGIAVALIDLHAFNAPVEAALKAGIPVVAYNADAPGNARLSYIGQDLKMAGEQMGERIVEAVGSGDVALFIATPGSANLQPRIEGAKRRSRPRASRSRCTRSPPARGPGRALDDRRLLGRPPEHEGHVRRRRRQHRKPRESDAEVRPAGQRNQGRRLRPDRRDAEAAAGRQHRIHDRPAALPSRASCRSCSCSCGKCPGSLTGPAETDTGLKFLNKETVAPYVESKTRFEGTSTEVKVVPIKAGTPA